MLTENDISVQPQMREAVSKGFFPAMLLDQRSNSYPEIIRFSLTKHFSSLHQFVTEVQNLAPLDRFPSELEFDKCRRAQEIAINATSLSSKVYAVLERYKRRGIPLALVSDVSSFWKPIVARLDLQRWFDVQVLSCATGSLKRDGRSWRSVIDGFQLPTKAAILIGDTWHSDGACALNAGSNAILVGDNSRSFAELILKRFTSLLQIDDAGSIRLAPDARIVLDRLAAGLSDEIEADPASALIVSANGIVSLKRFEGFAWMQSVDHALRHLLEFKTLRELR